MALCAIIACAKSLPAKADLADNLRAKLATANDSLRIVIYGNLFQLSQETGDINYQLRCVNELLAETQRQHNAHEEADARLNRVVLFYNNDMNDSVYANVPADLEFLKMHQQWHFYYEAWSYLANTYIYEGKTDDGIREAQAMFDDARQRNDNFGMGIAYFALGNAYEGTHDTEQSIKSFQQAVDFLSQVKPLPSNLSELYVTYGNVLNDSKQYNDLKLLTVRWKEFLNHFIEEKHMAGTGYDDIYLSYYNIACAQADLGLGLTESAATALQEAEAHIKRVGLEDDYVGMAWNLYRAELSLRQGKYQEALGYNTRRMEQMKASSDMSVAVKVRQQRAAIMMGLNRFEEAAELYREMYIINDSINKAETKEALNTLSSKFGLNVLEMKNERLRMDQERMRMEQERTRFRNIIIIISIIIASLAIFLFFRIRSARRLKQAHGKLQVAYADLKAANQVIEETTAAKERIESELRIARDIQMGMVPSTFPEDEQMDLYASMTPAKEVGGDLYNFLLIDHHLYFALGDVSGKGVPASLFMAQATRLFRTLAKQRLMPAEIATRMNDELGEDNEQGMFVTMFMGLIDLSTGHLYFCNAGHNPPVIGNGEGAQTSYSFMEMEPNAPIGLWPGLEYIGEEITDIRCRPIFVYTDGLNEAENMSQEQFGDDHLLDIMNTHTFVSSRQTVDMLKEEVEKHRNGAEPNDDLTMLCINIKNQD